MNTIILIFFTLGSLFAQDFVFDKEKGRAVPTYVGQIKLMKGGVYRKAGTETVDVKLGDRFKEGETVITGEKSFVKLLMVDDSVIAVGPSSEVVIAKFDYKDKSDRSVIIDLAKGQLTGDIKNRAKAGDITFKTKYTTMGVRGTYFLMNHQTIGSMDIAEYAVLRGKIEVEGHPTLSKGDRLGIIFDKAAPSVQDRRKLTDEESKFLDPKIDEDKEIKPFLPLLTIDEIKSSGTSTPAGDSQVAAGSDNEKRTDQKPHWKDNLKKLNEKLKERNKTR